MVELVTQEEMIEQTNVMTGGDDCSRQLLYQIRRSMKEAESIDIMVSFLMESGVKSILNDLKDALKQGKSIRILTGNYLGITQPSALCLIRHILGDDVDLRFYNDPTRSFHPKAYFFHKKDEDEVYVGSSNISKSGFTRGIEWNYRVSSHVDVDSYNKFYETFLDLFYDHSFIIDDKELKKYTKNWNAPSVYKDFERSNNSSYEKVSNLIEPRGAQIEALYALTNTRAEGASRALVLAATGIGKTYIAAFDSKPFKRVLFVAHREEILKQAAESFYNVRRSNDYGFFNGNNKCRDNAVIFASVSSLAKPEYLNEDYFARDAFDYIVIDEFHHAVTDQYKRIVQYFRPKFMLGLTATPERMDGKNIYELCEYNVPYEISLKSAINRSMLVPFHYYGIYDETDYSGIHLVQGRYSDHDLNRTYIGNKYRNELIYKYYKKYNSKRALGFCCTKEHAEEMAKDFCSRGIKAVSVYSGQLGSYAEDRQKAVQELNSGEIQVVFSVDMFNEGVDIPNVDMVMFLRPTESPTVFLQQLGRGLRKARGKEFLNVLDFIGNYEKAGRVRFLLGDMSGMAGSVSSGHSVTRYPDDCYVDFDMKLIDLFNTMEQNQIPLKDRIRYEFNRIEELTETCPTRMDMFTYMDDTTYDLCRTHAQINPFKRYMKYLYELGKLTPEQTKIYNSVGREFLELMENTNMSKVYKMPVLMAFYNNGHPKMAVTEQDLLKAWKSFFDKGMNWKDLKTDIVYPQYKRISDRAHLSNILKNPVHFLLKSGKGFFIEKEGFALAIRDDLAPIVQTEEFADQMKDIIEYRTMDYYRSRYRED